MQVEVIMPKMGESIQEGTILRWVKQVGDKVNKDETILEISTDKVDSEIPSPADGIISMIIINEQDTVPVGTIIAYIETDRSIPIENVLYKSHLNRRLTDVELQSSQNEKLISKTEHKLNKDRFYSPLVRSIIRKEGIEQQELEAIRGTGSNNRVTKKDILVYLNQRDIQKFEIPKAYQKSPTRNITLEELQKKYPSEKYRVVQLDNIQKKMADHMMRSVSISPHVTIVEEVDMTSIVNLRLSILQTFENKEGVKLTYMPFFGWAVVNALKEYPIVNSSLESDAIIYKNYINLGVAVASPSGLIVPIVRQADSKSFSELARDIFDVAARAKKKQLTPNDILDGTFSITNYGIFGSIIGTPIISQPQVAILGIGAIKKRPVVITDTEGGDSIQVRSMVYLTLSFDHRIIDGAIGGQFLARIRQLLESFPKEVVLR
jgi:2-oxoglutarate dehydrogenase E2 component (dihydrolipoamide succinyltransferase)